VGEHAGDAAAAGVGNDDVEPESPSRKCSRRDLMDDPEESVPSLQVAFCWRFVSLYPCDTVLVWYLASFSVCVCHKSELLQFHRKLCYTHTRTHAHTRI